MPGVARTELAAGHFVWFKEDSVGKSQLLAMRMRLIAQLIVTPE